MSNFDFLKDFDEDLWKLGNRIENEINISPSAVKADATPFLEHILMLLLEKINKQYIPRKDFYSQLDSVYREGLIPYNFKNNIYSAYLLRNKIHEDIDEIEKDEYYIALKLHKKLFYIAKKFYRDFNSDYDDYIGVPEYKPIVLDTSDDEIELIDERDFSEMLDISYDYCVACGEPNHSNYSIFCPQCNRVMDNANNFISIRNTFGKDAKFTKEDLIEYGMSEGYINQFLNSLVRENILMVKGRFISFNNLHVNEYLSKVDKIIAVGELLTKFIYNEITPKEIKETSEYKKGSFNQKPYVKFYNLVNQEIINKFEKDLLISDNIWDSIDFSSISQKQLHRWFDINLNNYQKQSFNESFIRYNQLLINDFLNLKRSGMSELEIKDKLNITPKIYDFWFDFSESFSDDLEYIKKELIIQALNNGKTKEEILEFAGVTLKEYNDLVKISNFKGDKFSKIRTQEIEKRKENFINYLKTSSIDDALKSSKLSEDDFDKFYMEDINSEFYKRVTSILMDKYLLEKRKGKKKLEISKTLNLDVKYIDYWFKRSHHLHDQFKEKNTKVNIDLIKEAFSENKSKNEIVEIADISLNTLNKFLELGKKGSSEYFDLYQYYEEKVIPKLLNQFLVEFKNKNLKKSLKLTQLSFSDFEKAYNLSKGNHSDFWVKYNELRLNKFCEQIYNKDKNKALRNADLTDNELNEFYQLGREGKFFHDFYNKYKEYKINIFLSRIIFDNKSKNKAFEISELSEDELDCDLEDMILQARIGVAFNHVIKGYTTKQIAKLINVKIEDIHEWFLKGHEGEDMFESFAKLYYKVYIKPRSLAIQSNLNRGIPLKIILNKARKKFTVEDYEFFAENGFLEEAQKEFEENDGIFDI